VLFTDLNPFSTLVASIKWMQTNKDLKFALQIYVMSYLW